MSRKIGMLAPAAPVRQEGEGFVKRYAMELVTPLMGGGAETGQSDPVTAIRGASIRGQLRFWWRATWGARFESGSALHQAEDQLWGTADEPSPVAVEVRNVKVEKKPAKIIVYPFNDKRETYEGYRGVFEVVVKMGKCNEFDDMKNGIEAALWAWVNFGGLGSRTRRGCGALYCEELAPSEKEDVQAWYQRKLEEYGLNANKGKREWPVLSEEILAGSALESDKALEYVNRLWGNFRQGVGIGRNPGQQSKRPGRSRWPEADSIRAQMGKGKYSESITTSQAAFPRAELGLPIVFQFKEERELNGSLYPVGKDRMASPVILKPLAISPRQAMPLVMVLCTAEVNAVELKQGSKKIGPYDQLAIRRPELKDYKNSPMKGRSEEGSAIEAFVHYAREKGMK